MKQTVQLENLSCQNCVKHVTQHFLSMEGVSDVTVDQMCIRDSNSSGGYYCSGLFGVFADNL